MLCTDRKKREHPVQFQYQAEVLCYSYLPFPLKVIQVLALKTADKTSEEEKNGEHLRVTGQDPKKVVIDGSATKEQVEREPPRAAAMSADAVAPSAGCHGTHPSSSCC